ncbi:putative G-protein coupled receptor-like protein [Trichinella pseudospiralis]
MKINYDALISKYLSCEQNWLRKFISRIVKQYLKLSQPDTALLYENFTNTVLLLLLLSSSRFASAKYFKLII